MGEGFAADDQAVNYITSHDVQTLPRLMTDVLVQGLADRGLLDGLRLRLAGMADWEIARFVVDQGEAEPPLAAVRDEAIERAAGVRGLCSSRLLVRPGHRASMVVDLDPAPKRDANGRNLAPVS